MSDWGHTPEGSYWVGGRGVFQTRSANHPSALQRDRGEFAAHQQRVRFLVHSYLQEVLEQEKGGLPGGPVVKTAPSNAGGAGSTANWGAKVPHAFQLKNQNTKHLTKFNRDCTNGSHKKKFFFKERAVL